MNISSLNFQGLQNNIHRSTTNITGIPPITIQLQYENDKSAILQIKNETLTAKLFP